CGLLLWPRRVGGLLARRIGLAVARQKRLRLSGAERGVASCGIGLRAVHVLALVALVVAHVGFRPVELRIALPELFLRGRDQAEVMLRVLYIIFRPNRIAGGLCDYRKLNVFFGHVGGSSEFFDIGSVRYE